MAGPLPKSKQQKTGYSCEFVEQPQKVLQTDCPICLGILRDPYQANCCGKCFCSACYKDLKSTKSINKACPTCNNLDFPAFEDKRQRHTLNELEVYCTHHNSGCQWTGELGYLDHHLNEDPKPGAEKEGCRFTKVGCPYCQEKFERQTLNTHPFDECPRRHVHCTKNGKGCHWEGKLADLALHLLTTCKANMVACPNKCGENNIHYQDVESHMEIHCPVKVVDCEFKPVGCQVQLPRKDMPGHLNDSSHHHMFLLMEKTHSLEAENIAKTEEVKILRATSAMQAEEVERLRANLQDVQRGVKNKVPWKWLILVSSVVVVVLAVLIQYAITQSSVTTEIRTTVSTLEKKLGQSEEEIADLSKESKSNHSGITDFQIQSSANYDELQTVVSVIEQKLRHTETEISNLQNESRDTTTHLQQQMSTLRTIIDHIGINFTYIQQGFSVHYFTLTEFKKCQAKDERGNWYSEPFYSHPGGYKFQLNVETNGDGDGYGLHGMYMSVYFVLLEGDHDDELDWPVSMTAHVQLLNQLGDHTHHEKTSTAEWSKRQRGHLDGRIAQFFKLSELGLNAKNFEEFIFQYLKNDFFSFFSENTQYLKNDFFNFFSEKNTQYLKNDCLKFRVYIKAYKE